MKRHIVLLLLLVAQATVSAQPTLEECKQLARKHYPLIRQYSIISQTEALSISNASRSWLPQLGFSAQASYQSDVPGWPEEFQSLLGNMGLEMPGMQKDQYKLQLELQQNVWDGGKSRSDKLIAALEAEQSRQSLEVELYAVERRVEEIFFGILLMQEQERQLSAMMQRLEQNLNYVNALVEEGVAMQSNADAVRVQLLSSKQSHSQVKANQATYRKMLELFIDKEIGSSELKAPEMVEPLDKRLRRPELGLFNSQIRLLEAKQKSAELAVMPRIGFFAQGFYGYPGLNMFENMMNDNLGIDGIVGVRMSWNISGFYTLKNSKRQIQTAMDAVRMQQQIFEFNSELQIEKESAEISRLRAALQDDDEIVRLRTRVREAAELRLQEGVIDTNDLLGKISDETTASIARSTREIELLKAIYDLKYTLNR